MAMGIKVWSVEIDVYLRIFLSWALAAELASAEVVHKFEGASVSGHVKSHTR